MKEIGGYFGLELNNSGAYHTGAIQLNSGRNALKFILAERRYQRVYLPYYICDAVLDAVNQSGTGFEFYSINGDFQPLFSGELKHNEALLYVDYFGLNASNTVRMAEKYQNLIIDNSLAFFAGPLPGFDTFYSPRKFFGVPDGAYLYTDITTGNLEQDSSYERCLHLLKRWDRDAASAYLDYRRNEDIIRDQPVKKMSLLTDNLLKSIDYDKIKVVRNRNFMFLHQALGFTNELKIDTRTLNGPLVYPLLISKKSVRQRLIKNKIYIPVYWPEVLAKTGPETIEYKLADCLLPLPVDQRYTENDMRAIVSQLFSALS